MYELNNNVYYFDSFGVEYILKENKIFIKNKDIKTNIFIIQAYDSIMCGYQRSTDFTNIFSLNDFEKSVDIILNHFMTNL